MHQDVTILIAEDDEGHATLIRWNLKRAGITNPILHFTDGQDVLDFLFRRHPEQLRDPMKPYLLLLDIRMPKVDGIEVLRQIKQDDELRKLPVIIITTTDNPDEIDLCHQLGCNSYIKKPIQHDSFIQAIRQLGLYLKVVEVSVLDSERDKEL